MKKQYFFLLTLFFCIFVFSFNIAQAFDIIGLQPVSPSGVFSAFSTESVERNSFSFDLTAEKSEEPDFSRFAFKISYGISDSLEFNITIPYVSAFSHSIDGLEDISIGLKHRFYEEGIYGPSIAYLLTASMASGNNTFTSEGSYGAGIIISKKVGPIKGHFNLLYSRPGTDRLEDSIVFIGAAEFAAAHNFILLGELMGKKGYYSDEYNQLEARVGYRMRAGKSLTTTLGVGLDLKNRTPEYRILISFSFSSVKNKGAIRKIYEEE